MSDLIKAIASSTPLLVVVDRASVGSAPGGGWLLVWMVAAAYAPRPFVKPIGIAAVLLTLAVLVLTQGWTL